MVSAKDKRKNDEAESEQMNKRLRQESSPELSDDTSGESSDDDDLPPPVIPSLPEIPTNTTMPENLTLPKSEKGHLKVVTWNVNSLQASLKKGFKTYLKAEDPDVLCLQETKLNEVPSLLFPKTTYPHQYFTMPTNGKKGYSGSAVLCKVKPLSVAYGLGNRIEDDEGRVITLEFPQVFLVAAYVPNAGVNLKRLDFKVKWDNAMKDYLSDLDSKKPVIYAGDLNVAHEECDLARPKSNSMTAGFTKEERADFSQLLVDNHMVDVWRHRYPGQQRYTYFSYRFGCRTKQLGWRLDYFVASQRVLPQLGECVIRDQCYGASDHVPLLLFAHPELFLGDKQATEAAAAASSEASSSSQTPPQPQANGAKPSDEEEEEENE